jgi:hypothetical protein
MLRAPAEMGVLKIWQGTGDRMRNRLTRGASGDARGGRGPQLRVAV